MEHFSNDNQDHPNQHENSHKLYDVNMMESQWKIRQQHDQNFQCRESHCRTNTSIRKKENLKEQDCENHSVGSK